MDDYTNNYKGETVYTESPKLVSKDERNTQDVLSATFSAVKELESIVDSIYGEPNKALEGELPWGVQALSLEIEVKINYLIKRTQILRQRLGNI